ncbi:MAG: hypothetical protein IJ752_07340 [Alphaproteobacteria bacterium]|nr:hypothetical protein [Alphaproteobacteria bacterium]
MNKIVFLKLLIAVITFLIFLTLGGIVYGLVNYKTTPKLLSRKRAPIVQTVKQTDPQQVPLTYLGLKKGEYIKDSHACGDMLCLRIQSDFEGNKIILFDPASLQIRAVLIAAEKPAAE